MTPTNPVRLAALVLFVSACGRSSGTGSEASPSPAESTPSPGASTPKPVPTAIPTPEATPTAAPTPARPKGCRSACEELIAAFLARNGGRHPFRLSLMPGEPVAGYLVTTPSESNPRQGVFGFEGSVPQELPFTTGTYILQGEFLALFSNSQDAGADTGPLLFRQAFVGAQAEEILTHVHVLEPRRRNVPLFVFP